MPLHRTEPRTIYQHSKYVSSDEDEASEAWESILAGHGVVAIEPEYAAAKSLPNTVVLPNSGGKLTYVIEAYHAIHCIVRIPSVTASLFHTDNSSRLAFASTTWLLIAMRQNTGLQVMIDTASMHFGSMSCAILTTLCSKLGDIETRDMTRRRSVMIGID